MNRRHISHLVALLLGSLLLRYLLIPYVGVWGDFGFWAWDARQIAAGQQPFIDFTGRSPLAVYLLAVVVDAVGLSVYSMRTTVLVLWTLTGVPVYAMARYLSGHRAGLVAVAAFALTPYPLVYGMWLNSQSMMAVFAASAIALLLYRETHAVYAVGGVLFGLAFLSRRSVIVVCVAVGLWTAWRQYRTQAGLAAAVGGLATRGSLMLGAFLGTLGVGYYFTAGGYLPHAIEIYSIDFVGLFLTLGNGSYPIVGVDLPRATPRIEEGRIPILNNLCGLCTAWTPRIALKMVILSLPVIGVFWVTMRDLTDRYFIPRDTQYMYGVLGLFGLYGAVKSLALGFPVRFLAIVALGAFALTAYRFTAERELSDRHPGAVLLWAVVAMLVVGYLYRNRKLHVYYLMDFWPFFSVLAGVVGVRAWGRLSQRGEHVLVAALALALVVSTATATPFTTVALGSNEPGFFTVSNLPDISADISQRVGAGGFVMAAFPSYVALSDANFPMNETRSYMIGFEYHGTAVAEQYYANLTARMRDGRVQLVVLDQLTADVLAWNDTAEHLFETRYCRVVDPGSRPLYADTNATRYTYQLDCPAHRRPNATASRPPLGSI